MGVPIFSLVVLTLMLAAPVLYLVPLSKFQHKTVYSILVDDLLGLSLGFPDHYAVLGLENSLAGKPLSQEVLKKAFRDVSLLHHPDKKSQSTSAGETGSFLAANEAMDVLNNEDRRKEYDLKLRAAKTEHFERLSRRSIHLTIALVAFCVVASIMCHIEILSHQAKKVERDVAAATAARLRNRELEKEAMQREVELYEQRKKQEEELKRADREFRRINLQAKAVASERALVEGHLQARAAQQRKMEEEAATTGIVRKTVEQEKEQAIKLKREEWRFGQAPNTHEGRGGSGSGHQWNGRGRRVED